MQKHIVPHEEALNVLALERGALERAANLLNRDAFDRAAHIMLAAPAHVVVTGMGKSGHVAAKIAATLASTGTPAFYLHPAEAVHGDLGMLTRNNVVLALSHSGNTEEVLNLLPYVHFHQIPLIVITGCGDSHLAKKATVALAYDLEKEACPLNLAPTASTITQMALGDALSMALMKMRGFTDDDFAMRHPLGTLGRRLLMRVCDLMVTGDEAPVMPESAKLMDAISRMMRLGAVSFVNGEGRLTGIFCDGDLRRLFQRGGADPEAAMGEVMIRNPKRINADALCTKAVDLMTEYKISVLPVVDEDERPVGMIDLKILTRAGITG